MAAALQCEICGGKLIGKPGGMFECDSCGMEYSTEWAKAKIQEIKGTVKVEGTVEVTGKVQVEGGTVQVEGAATTESLLKRAKLCLEDKDWDKAKELIEQALNGDPENGYAYLLRDMAEKKYSDEAEEIAYYVNINHPESENLKKAFRFSNASVEAFREKLEPLRQKDREAHTAFAKKLPALRAQISPAQDLLCSSRHHTIGLKADGTVVAAGDNRAGQCNVNNWTDVVSVDCGDKHTVGLKADGTVIATQYSGDPIFYHGQCDVDDWQDIVAIACGDSHTVGLKEDGSVVATNFSIKEDSLQKRHLYHNQYDGQCDVENWQDIVAIACGDFHTVGLKSDGTVVAVGSNKWGECNVSSWQDIVAIVCGASHTVGLKADGTVIAVGHNLHDQCKTNDWHDIVTVICGASHTVGLQANGTVVATKFLEKRNNRLVGERYAGQCEVDGWQEIVNIVCNDYVTIGQKADGTVVAAGKTEYGQCDISHWTDIIAISCNWYHTVGLKSDGTVVAVGDNDGGECDVSGWKLFNSFDTLEEERAAAKKAAEERRIAEEKAAEERRIAEEKAAEEARLAAEKARQEQISKLDAEKSALNTELANLKGMFSGKRRKEIEARLAVINADIERLK